MLEVTQATVLTRWET